MSALLKPKYDYLYEEQQSLVEESKKVIVKKKRKKSRLNFSTLKSWFMIITIFSMGLSIIYNYTTITEKKMEINNLEREITEFNNKIDSSNIYLESLNNTNMIENMAKNYFGMSYPSRKQTVFLSSKSATNEDVQISETSAEDKKLNILEKTYNYFAKKE